MNDVNYSLINYYILSSQNNIVSTFSKLQTVVNENYQTEDQLLIGCPTPEQVSVLLSSTILSKKRCINNDLPKEADG